MSGVCGRNEKSARLNDVRYALISDIHANLPALEAVLRDIAQRSDTERRSAPGKAIARGLCTGLRSTT
jgi:hypothetical protein